jgi:hypothetical protein
MRFVVWLTGCQFRCVYCHNPDTWKINNGIPVTWTRAVEEIQKYRHTLQTTKGGLTISGGEPLVQHRFVLKVFEAVKKSGIHTALDSNGYLGARLSDADLAAIDLVLLDLKAMTPDLHRRLTGVDNQSVHELARRLAAARKPVWVRFVSCRAGLMTGRGGAHRGIRRGTTSSGWTCCRFTRWAASNGRSLGSTIRSRTPSRPRAARRAKPSPYFERPG